jgi:hypothetical protein
LHQSGQALLEIINDILDFSKIEAGQLRLEALPLDPRDLVIGVTRLFMQGANAKGLSLETVIDPAVRQRFIGDPVRLRQILSNFVSNALKFTNAGGVTVALSVAGEVTGARMRLRFSVRDTGIGIPEKTQARLFQPFTQADGSITRRFGGTGLGLAICKRLVDEMHGKIGIISVPDKGSEFWFEVELPALQRADEEAVPPASPETKDMPQVERGLHVLLVEDNAANQLMAQTLLKKLGCTFDLAENGIAALKAVESTRYDLVLMDCMMPDMDGYEATRRLRARETGGGRRLPVIALTANALSSDGERCRAAGMDDYVAKPYSLEQLKDAIDRVTEGERKMTAWA